MSDKKHRVAIPLIAVLGSAIITVLAGWLLLNRQYVADQATVWTYQPSGVVQDINRRVGFTETGKFYFYASQPAVAAAGSFNQDCPRQEPGSPIIGCYADGRIFIYDISNRQLDGIEEVTAAHEMLHAVWERTGQSEKDRLSKLLDAVYSNLSSDDPLRERMEYYMRAEPGQFYNELHSIIGTEKRTIGKELESYYARFFTDRQIVLAMHDSYNSIFNTLQHESEQLYGELTQLGSSIEKRSSSYERSVSTLAADIGWFNQRANSNDFASINQFYAERAVLTSRINELEAERQAINTLINRYNKKHTDYKDVAQQIDTLNQSLDSFSALRPVPSL